MSFCSMAWAAHHAADVLSCSQDCVCVPKCGVMSKLAEPVESGARLNAPSSGHNNRGCLTNRSDA